VAVVVKLDGKRSAAERPSLDRLVAVVERDLPRVNQLIIDRMHSDVPLIPQLAGHIVAAGGKRLRPMLTLAAARLCEYEGDRHLGLAAIVEFIHTATLLHDDVVDESALRRGLASANAVWGNKASVLVGDFLFSRAFQLMVDDGSMRILEILSNASAVIAEGEVAQLVTANDTETSEAAYLDVVRAKTATLFAAACQIGAVVADRPRVEEEALDVYGMNLGVAFQLVDDVIDYSSSQTDMGKSAGDDFRDGKITLPVVLAFRRGNEEERRFWRRTLEDQTVEDGDFEHALALLERHDALVDAVERAGHYGAIARDALGIFPDSEVKGALLDAIDFSIDRVS